MNVRAICALALAWASCLPHAAVAREAPAPRVQALVRCDVFPCGALDRSLAAAGVERRIFGDQAELRWEPGAVTMIWSNEMLTLTEAAKTEIRTFNGFEIDDHSDYGRRVHIKPGESRSVLVVAPANEDEAYQIRCALTGVMIYVGNDKVFSLHDSVMNPAYAGVGFGGDDLRFLKERLGAAR